MKTTLLVFLICMSIFFNGYSQKKTNIKEEINRGITFYKQGNFKDAAKYFTTLLRQYPNEAQIMYWCGRCYEEADEKQKAADIYLKVYKRNKKAAPDLLYKVGRAYHLKLNYKEALSYYKQYQKLITPERAKILESTVEWEKMRTSKMISECESGIRMMAKPSKHRIANLGKTINTPYEEYTPLISADNKKLFFTSRRPGGTTNEKEADNTFFEDIWYTVKDSKGTWGAPKNIGAPVNSDSHDACIALSPDGKELFLYKTSNGGDIYSSVLENDHWTKPKSIGKTINSKYQEASMSISADNNVIYFSSNRPGGLGGLDIYVTTKNSNGEWDEPQNLGPVINTKFEDDGPFISYDGKTLYFSSNGHNSMGGFDIFRTTYDAKSKTWAKPVNMGFPINSPDDDIFFVIAADKKTAYYASGKKGGFGEKDLFTIDIDTSYFTPKVSKEALANQKNIGQAKNVVYYNGKVFDESTGLPLECILHINKLNADDKTADFKTNADGTFKIPLAKGAYYGINVEKNGFLFFSHTLDLTQSGSSTMVMEDFKLKKPQEGQKIVLKNIFYQTGKASLTSESYQEIFVLLDFLVKNPKLKIEVSGHTDNRGTKELNKQISTARAKTIYDILIKKGIAKERLSYAGYGSERPIASNATEDGKRKNRRTEFEIIDIMN